MTLKNIESFTNSSNQTRSVFFCPESSEYIWDLNNTIPFKITVAITTIACPVTILLNLLGIIAVKTRRELKQISNILLCGVASTDLLVGAISLPLSIAPDALVINRVLVVDIICTIDFISVSVLHIGCWSSKGDFCLRMHEKLFYFYRHFYPFVNALREAWFSVLLNLTTEPLKEIHCLIGPQ